MECISPFPCSQSCISLSSPELGLIAWCIWGSRVAADVEDCDALAILIRDLSKEVWVRVFVWGFAPGFPHGAELHNHLCWRCRALCQGHRASKEGTAFGLGPAWCSCYGPKTLQLSHGLGVKA